MIYWSNTPAMAEARRIAEIKALEYKIAVRKNLNKMFFGNGGEFYARTNGEWNLIISAHGETGSGKSWFIIASGEKYLALRKPSQKLKIKNCFFTLTELLDGIEFAEEGDVLILDEQVYTAGYGSRVEAESLENAEMTIRKSGISLFFAAPKQFKHQYHFFFKTWKMGATKPWNFLKPIKNQWKYTKCLVFSSNGDCMGSIITQAPQNTKFLRAYEKKKDKAILAYRKQKGSLRVKFHIRKVQELLKDQTFLTKFVRARTKKLRVDRVSEFLGGVRLSGRETEVVADRIIDEIEFNPKYKEWLEFMPKKFQKSKKRHS
jgi:hypothetical protein